MGAGAALVMVPLVSCTPEEEPLPPGAVRVRLTDVPDGARTNVLRGDEPVELLRTGGEVRARSLLCTHFGCTLAWNQRERRYDCPCHGGAFDADCSPIAGPPTEPMRVLPTRLDGDMLILYPRAAGVKGEAR